jgi:hypothetical protein
MHTNIDHNNHSVSMGPHTGELWEISAQTHTQYILEQHKKIFLNKRLKVQSTSKNTEEDTTFKQFHEPRVFILF